MSDQEKFGEGSTNGPEEERRQGPAFKFLRPANPPDDTFADGAAGIIAGRNVVKIDFYRVAGFDREDNREIRTVSQRLVLPLNSIPELMRLLRGFGQAVQQAADKRAARSATESDS